MTGRVTARRAVPAASAAVPTVVYPTAFEDVGLQAATAAGSTPVDIVRAGLADRGVNSSTHGHVASDATIAEELKAQGGHIGRTVNRLLSRTGGVELPSAAVPAASAAVPTVVPAVVPTASTAVPMAVLPGVVLPGVVLPGAVPQTPVPADPLEAMRNLKAMLDGGMIDQNEYEAKKSELMARM